MQNIYLALAVGFCRGGRESQFVLWFLFISCVVAGFRASRTRCKANWVSARYDLLSRFLRNRQACG